MGAGCSSQPPVLPRHDAAGHGRLQVEPRASSAPEISANSPARECPGTERGAFSFAMCSGVRYADKTSTSGWPEKHRHALDKLMHAARHWVMPEEEISFVLNLGDMIARNSTESKVEHDLHKALKLFDSLARTLPVYQALGTEANVKSKKALLHRMGLEGTYYSRPLPLMWRLVVLDTQQQCMPNPSSSSGASPHEVVGVGKVQLAWLQAELEMAAAAGERVIVAAHDILVDGLSSKPELRIGNTQAVQEILTGSPATCLVLCAGGDDGNCYFKDSGVHFLTIPAMVNSPAASVVPYCIFEIEGEDIGIRGFGGIPDRILRIRPAFSGRSRSRARRSTEP